MALTKRVRIVLWIVGGVAAVIGGFVLWLAASLSGGLDNLLDLSHPTADSREVRAAAASARPRNEALLQQLLPRTPYATAVGDDCATGQHNWMVDDPYDLHCHLSDGALIVGSPEEVARDRDTMPARLIRAGFVTDASSRYVERAGVRVHLEEPRPGNYRLLLPSVPRQVRWQGATGEQLPEVRVPFGSVGLLIEVERDYFEG